MYVIDVAKVVLFFEMSKFFPIFSDAEARRNVALTLTASTSFATQPNELLFDLRCSFGSKKLKFYLFFCSLNRIFVAENGDSSPLKNPMTRWSDIIVLK